MDAGRRTIARWRHAGGTYRCFAKAGGGSTITPLVLGHQTNLHVTESSALYRSLPCHLRCDQ